MKVFLVGPMGTGKSTTGKDLSEKLGYEFYDTDKLVEKAEGLKIKEIFEKKGENYFRLKESEALNNTNPLNNVVIATGGGIVEKEVNRLFLKKESKVIFLDSSAERQHERTKASSKRPLLNNGDALKTLRKLYKKRLNMYKEVSKIQISMDNLKKEEILKKIINFLSK